MHFDRHHVLHLWLYIVHYFYHVFGVQQYVLYIVTACCVTFVFIHVYFCQSWNAVGYGYVIVYTIKAATILLQYYIRTANSTCCHQCYHWNNTNY